MRVPYAWLKSYCDPLLSAEALADRLALSTAEVERIERVGVGDPANFVIGKVVSAEQHPNADRLRVCTVDDGSGDPRTIVCGAPNVAAGQTVAVALPGAVMPDGQKLGEAKLRGIRSSGMILAEDEVGVGTDHDGIMVLSDDLSAGSPLIDAVPVFDEVLELEVNPNRPDLLSVYGVAREVHALSGQPLRPDPTGDDPEPSGGDRADDHVAIEIDPEVCLRFTARVFEDVKIGPSPVWLKQRLIAAGQRPISNVVDITNYVMLATGQPLHAFDLDEVRGSRIVVRRAREGERFKTLDDVDRGLDPSIAVVADAEGPSGIAGIMGGQISEVSENTTRVLMEAATWVGPNIMRSEATLGLRTEASTRFEKQLHPDNAISAQRLAARLMVDLCGARYVPGTIDVYPNPAATRTVALRVERSERLLGVDVPAEEIEATLGSLGFALAPGEDETSYRVEVPWWRDGDVQREADLIEEVGRIHGLDKIPATLPARAQAVGRLNPSQLLRRRLEDELRGRGMAEIIAYSFTRPDALEQLRLGDVPPLRVANPLSEEQSVMRPLLLPGLLDAATRNAAHGRPGVRLFESAHVYRNADPTAGAATDGGSPRGQTPASERHHIGALTTQAQPATWRTPERPADFYAAKAMLAALMAPTGLDWWVEPGDRPYLHPGRAATILAGGEQKVGWVGELHPLVARAWDLGPAAAFEVDADLLVELGPGRALAEDLMTFPALLQDIAVVVEEGVAAAEVERAVRDGGGKLLRDARVFDVYRGEQVGAGRKSLALRLEFRAGDRTLTDEDVAERRAAIESRLADQIGGRLRG